MYSVVNSKFLYLELRLILAIIMSIIIIVADGKLNMFLPCRSYIEGSVYLFYYICDRPCYVLNYVLKILEGYNKLVLENNILRQELFLKNSELLLTDQYKQENYKLHELFNSPLYCNKRRMVARILFVNTDPYSSEVIINQGKKKGVYIGQPIITDVGIIGQVTSVSAFSSRVMLICDPAHAVPVQIKRNNMRFILMGCGRDADLRAEHLGNIDVCVGDILVTSGLDGRFPEGYPVAVVSSVMVHSGQDITVVQAHSTVKLQCLRYVVLLWE